MHCLGKALPGAVPLVGTTDPRCPRKNQAKLSMGCQAPEISGTRTALEQVQCSHWATAWARVGRIGAGYLLDR